MFCYVYCYFVILFCLLHFLFQRYLVLVSVFLYIWRIGDDTAYRAFESLKITAREIP